MATFRTKLDGKTYYFTIGSVFSDYTKTIYNNACIYGCRFDLQTPYVDMHGKQLYENDVITNGAAVLTVLFKNGEFVLHNHGYNNYKLMSKYAELISEQYYITDAPIKVAKKR